MKVGTIFSFQNPENRMDDGELYRDELRMACRAESMGFDSVWGIEHHFTDYILSPDVLQFLTYVGARTERVELGSAVVVLPWHDPIRVAEQVSVLDHMTDGRVLFGMGRGLARVEFDGFRVSMDESRQRFQESAEAILQALETGTMEYEGQYIRQPKADIRPKPLKSFRGRSYAASVSEETGAILAKLGVGMLIIAQKPWEQMLEELASYRALYRDENGEEAPSPVLHTQVICDEDEGRAEELAHRYIAGYFHTVVKHYEVASDQFGTARGYEGYKAMKDVLLTGGPDAMAGFFKDLQVWGTPEQCFEKAVDMKQKSGAEHMGFGFRGNGMPIDEANRSMELFAEQVLPELKKID